MRYANGKYKELAYRSYKQNSTLRLGDAYTVTHLVKSDAI
jgi:hypothetical protein